MEISILFLPLIASIISGFFGKYIGDRNSEILTSVFVTISAFLSILVLYQVIVNQYEENIIVILMSIELILLAVNINLVSFSIFLGDLAGQVFTLFILTVAAAEAAIGLAIIVVYYRNSGTIRVEEIDKLKG